MYHLCRKLNRIVLSLCRYYLRFVMTAQTIQQGRVKIICQPYTYSGEKFCVTLQDTGGKICMQTAADEQGQACMQVQNSGIYCIRVRIFSELFPLVQYRWVKLSPDKNYTLYFIFHPVCIPSKQTNFTIRVSDKHYSNLVFEGVTFNLGFQSNSNHQCLRSGNLYGCTGRNGLYASAKRLHTCSGL